MLGATVGPFGAVLGASFGAVLVAGGEVLDATVGSGFWGALVGGCRLDSNFKTTLDNKERRNYKSIWWRQMGAQSNVGEACSDCEMKGEGPANMHAFLTKKHVDCRHLNLLQATTEKEQRTKISPNV